MAEEEITETTESEDPPAKSGLKAKLPLIGGIVAGVLIGSGTGLYFLGPKLSHAAPAHASASKDHGAKADSAKHEVSPIYQIDNLVLNPAGSNGTRFLLLSVALEVKDEAAATSLKGRDAELRDAILRLFGAKTAEEVSEASLREALRAELLDTVSKILPAGTVRKVYFPQFVIQ